MRRIFNAWKDDFVFANIDLSYAIASMKWVFGALAALFLSFPLACQALAIFIMIDWATGMLAAFKNKAVSSERAGDGFIRKILTLLLVVTGYLLTRFLKLDVDLGSMLATVYACNEVISIIENCSRAGVYVPPFLIDALLKAKTMTGHARRSEDPATELRDLAKEVSQELKGTAKKTAGKLVETAEKIEKSSPDPQVNP